MTALRAILSAALAAASALMGAAFAAEAEAMGPPAALAGEAVEPILAGPDDVGGDARPVADLPVADRPAGAGGLTARVVQLFLAVTVLSAAPGLAMTVTCLPFMLIVLSILRQGVGLQQAPPSMLIVSVALFLTYFVMEPVFREAWAAGAAPLIEGRIDEAEAFARAMAPFRGFMLARVDPEALTILHEARGLAGAFDPADPPNALLIPGFVLSEIQRAFQVGFVVLLPFLVIDLVIASILMAMGMMMVPPAIVSLPFKIAFFVLTNGWVAVSGALVRSYG